MLTFDVNKEKKLEMMIETQGIDPQSLEFTFRILIEGIEYGFPAQLIGNKVVVTIPPLSEVLAQKIESGDYNAKLEVNGENKYYLKPFNEQVHIKIEPKVEVTLDDDNERIEEKKNFDLKLSSITEEDAVTKTKEKSVIKKKKESKFLKSLK